MPFKSFVLNPDAIRRIVFAGCGVKGIGYSGAYQAMDETGVVKDAQQVSGSSSGAISAAMMAAGVKPRQFRELMTNVNLADLSGAPSWSFFKKNPVGSCPLSTSGQPLEQFIKRNLLNSVNEFLNSHKHALEDKPELQALRMALNDNPNRGIHFIDLVHLHQYFPEQFKPLTVNAVQYPNGEVTIFNAQNTPNLDVAKACRASASVPILLEPAVIDGKGYLDGSLFDNIPTDYFGDRNTSQTLIFCFGQSQNPTFNSVYQALYGSQSTSAASVRLYQPSLSEYCLSNYAPKILIGLNMPYLYTDRDEEVFKRLKHDYPLRTVMLQAQGMQAFDFEKSKQFARELNAFGYLDTIQFIIQHDLYDSDQFNAAVYYANYNTTFKIIYRAYLVAAMDNPDEDPLWVAITALEHETPKRHADVVQRELFQLIKSFAERDWTKAPAFALVRSYEYRHDLITLNTLTDEIDKTTDPAFKSNSIPQQIMLGLVLYASVHSGLVSPSLLAYAQQRFAQKKSPQRLLLTEVELSKLVNDSLHNNYQQSP